MGRESNMVNSSVGSKSLGLCDSVGSTHTLSRARSSDRDRCEEKGHAPSEHSATTKSPPHQNSAASGGNLVCDAFVGPGVECRGLHAWRCHPRPRHGLKPRVIPAEAPVAGVQGKKSKLPSALVPLECRVLLEHVFGENILSLFRGWCEVVG